MISKAQREAERDCVLMVLKTVLDSAIHLRVGQLLSNCIGESKLFYIEDSKLLELLMEEL